MFQINFNKQDQKSLPSGLGGGGLGGSSGPLVLPYPSKLFLFNWLILASDSGCLNLPLGAKLFLSSGNELGPLFGSILSSNPPFVLMLGFRVGGCTYKFWFEYDCGDVKKSSKSILLNYAKKGGRNNIPL